MVPFKCTVQVSAPWTQDAPGEQREPFITDIPIFVATKAYLSSLPLEMKSPSPHQMM